MVKKKENSKVLEFFGILDQEQEYYDLVLKKAWMQSLARRSRSTLDKILASPSLIELEEEKGYCLRFEKYYGYSTGETAHTRSEIPKEVTSGYIKLQQELLKAGKIKDDEIGRIILTPSEWHKLTDEQVEKASEIYNAFAFAQETVLSQVTIAMKRAVKRWQPIDTQYLHQEMGEEIVEFINNEVNGWDKEQEDVEGKSPQSTPAT